MASAFVLNQSRACTLGGGTGPAQTLNRSSFMLPFHTGYINNGSGRDSYIYSNNGGFYNANDSYCPDLGTFYTRSKSQLSKVSPSRNAPKYAPYRIDGTGRDSYISCNNGGFSAAKMVAEYKRNYFD